jgi:[phosphatase 2A protein]-leucine-carboxy methyltransferase
MPPRRRHDSDKAIRQTDTDASQARLSAVRKGYLKDPFASYFVPEPHLAPNRSPLINLGTYVRSRALDELILSWINKAAADGRKVQIVSLGAGSDTRFWRIAVSIHQYFITRLL